MSQKPVINNDNSSAEYIGELERKVQLLEEQLRINSKGSGEEAEDNGFEDDEYAIDPEQQPGIAERRKLLRQDAAVAILLDIKKYRKSGVFTQTTAGILEGWVKSIGKQDFLLANIIGQKSNELRCDFNIDLIFASCGIPREDRESVEFIDILNRINFQYSHQETRAQPNASGLTERDRHHVNIDEHKHTYNDPTFATARRPGLPGAGLINWWRSRGQPQEYER